MKIHWVNIELGDVCELYQPKTISSKKLIEDGEYPVYGANGIIGNYDQFNHEESQLLITCRGASCGNVHISKPFAWINGNAMVVKPMNLELLDLFYLKYFFSVKSTTAKAIGGSAQPQITRSSLSPTKLYFPPLPEQRAIVAKIEQLFSDLDNGIANLKKAKKQLKVFRQTVLKKAFEGELTKTWREQQTNLPTADELLTQIKEEREKQYQTQLKSWKAAVQEWEKNGKEEKKPSRPKKPKEVIRSTECEINIPENWCYGALQSIAQSDVGYAFKSKEFKDEGVKLLRGENIEPGSLRWKDVKYWNPNDVDVYKNLLVNDGDVILAMDRPIISSGIKVAIARTNNDKILLVQRVARINSDTRVNKYIFYILNTQSFINHCIGNQTGTQLPHISQKQIDSYPIGIPPKEEQHQIVQEIESRLSVCDKVEESIEENLKKSEALRQSILKKAFEGKLLTEAELETCRQQADWEPAEKLLTRIEGSRNERIKESK